VCIGYLRCREELAPDRQGVYSLAAAQGQPLAAAFYVADEVCAVYSVEGAIRAADKAKTQLAKPSPPHPARSGDFAPERPRSALDALEAPARELFVRLRPADAVAEGESLDRERLAFESVTLVF
jgi:hypothetical protein